MDVVLYLRYSSNRQTEQSIEGQRHVCEKFCERSGYTIVGEYVDRATTATKHTDKRTDFLRMIKESDKKLWQAVVVYKLDRFARNRYDSATYKAKLKKNGVKVISATENLSDNPEGILLESVLEGMAEFYSKELSQKVSRGMRETAMKGNSCGCKVPLGYKIVNKKFVIDEKTAPAVQIAFKMYADGERVVNICQHLNNLGFRTQTGAEFNKNSFNTMFRNRKYIGIYQYMDIELQDAIPAIIDNETFDRVQARLKRRAAAPARGKAIVEYMLSGKMFCGYCGKPMIGTASTSATGRKYFYYYCGGQRQHSGCPKTPVPKELIEQAVVQDSIKLLTPEWIDYLTDLAMKGVEEERANNTLIPAYETQIAETERSINNLLKLVENGADSPTLSVRLNTLEKQLKDLKKSLADEESQAVGLDRKIIKAFFKDLSKGNVDDIEFQRRIIDLFVNSVYVWDNDDQDGGRTFDVTITYNFSPVRTAKITVKDVKNSAFLAALGSPLPAYTHYPYLISRYAFAINVKYRF